MEVKKQSLWRKLARMMGQDVGKKRSQRQLARLGELGGKLILMKATSTLI